MKKPDKIQQKRLRKKKQSEFNLREEFASWWQGKNPVLKFSLGFAVLMGVFYGFWFTDFFTNNILIPFTRFNALVAANILALFGQHATVIDARLSSGSITIDVGRGCDALEPMAIFLCAVLLFPAPFKAKLFGVLGGIPILFALNILRIITLYLAGAHGGFLFGAEKEFYFNLLHLQIWPVIFIVATLMLLAGWIIYSLKSRITPRANL
ncbi:MAG: archaeosortase/exosortase family protein [Chitinophagales bacterium]|nr:archaeosortase/exosortase family protein [Chitinophagales bacterium]